jgi:membrane-associated phospholipid phosphatase
MEVGYPTRQSRLQLTAENSVGYTAASRLRSDGARAWLIAISLLLIGYAMIPCDTTVASFIRAHRDWAGWKIVLLSEIFAHAWGVGLIALGIASLRPGDAIKIPQLFWGSLGAGLAANVFKLICARTRPHSYDLNASSWDTFQGWFPWWNGAYQHATNLSSLQSFPSAHSATAAGLAWGLSRLYPAGRWYFVLLCTLAMAQRLVVQAHYLSDVCWGAALGVIWANIVFSDVRLGRVFAVIETWLSKRWKIDCKNA